MSFFRRLFREHLGFTLVFGIFWFLIVTVSMIGPEDARYPNPGPALIFLTALTILVSFAWMNSKHFHETAGAFKKHAFTWGTALVDLAVFAFLFALPAVIFAPAYGNYAIRSRMNEMVSSVSALKTEVAEAAQSKGTLSGAAAGLKVGTHQHADYALLSPDGTIVAYSERYGALVVLTPSMSGGSVSWRCQGYPERLFPAACRGDSGK